MAQRYFDLLGQALYDALEIMRVYAKPPRREPDLSAPFVLKRGSTVEEFAAKVHQDFVRNLQSARVWGQGVFDGQMVGREHVLHEGDIVELRS
jgi:ribosome-interacting GTPase 1